MKKKLLVLALLIIFSATTATAEKTYMSIRVDKVFWSTELSSWIAAYTTWDNKTAYIALNSTLITPPDIKLNISDKTNRGFKAKGTVQPDYNGYSYKWELTGGPDGKVKEIKSGKQKEVSYKNLAPGRYYQKLTVLDSHNNELGFVSETIDLVEYAVNVNITQDSLVNYEHYKTIVRASINYNSSNVEAWIWEVNGNIMETKTNSNSYLFEPGSANTVTVKARMKDKQVIASQPRTYTASGLPSASITIVEKIGPFDTEENKAVENTWDSVITRTDQINKNDLVYKLDGEEINPNSAIKLSPGIYTVVAKHTKSDATAIKETEIKPPTINKLYYDSGDFNDQGQRSITIRTPIFSQWNIRNTNKGSFKITNLRDGKTLPINEASFLPIGRHDVLVEFFNSTGVLISQSQDLIVVEQQALKVSFQSTFRSKMPPSATNKWRTRSEHLGQTGILQWFTDSLPGDITWDIKITTEEMLVVLTGTMKSENHSSVIQSCLLKGTVTFNNGILKTTLKGDAFLEVDGQELDKKTVVKVPLSTDLVFAVVKLADDGYALEDIVISLYGEGGIYAGRVPDQPRIPEETTNIETDPIADNDNECGRIEGICQCQDRNEFRPPRVFNLNWRHGMLDVKKTNYLDEQRLVIWYNTKDFSIINMEFYIYSKVRPTYIFPGRYEFIMARVNEQMASSVRKIYK